MSDEDIDRLKRGGHDPIKIYAAYHAAVNHRGRPTVILAQTKKGYGMGTAAQGKMAAHQAKKLEDDTLLAFRDRFALPLSDSDVHDLRFYKPAADSPEMKYLHARRAALGGYVPARAPKGPVLPAPALDSFGRLLEGTGDREQSTTMVFVNMLSQLLRDKTLGRHIVPIVADEARTFGMQSLFRQVAIYSPHGQLYEPEDKDELLYYKEAKDGQILEEGITEAGAISSWIAAATSYSVHGVPMLPFYIFYSCFGFQRIGDLLWSAGDSRARGFLLGATAGRTTLSGEGLQHEDGSSHLLFSTVPNCVAYDPAFGYELTVIIRDGMRRMLENQEDVFYYITVMNENYAHPAMPAGAEDGILRGMYRIREARGGRREAKSKQQTVQLLGAGTILREVLAAAELLESDWNVGADVWSVTSFTELRRDGIGVERHNRLHPVGKRKQSWVEQCLEKTAGPVIAASDYMRTVADLIRNWVPRRYVALGTDGFGRSDTRERLREFFEVDRRNVAVAALKALADEGAIDATLVRKAIGKYAIGADRPNPWDA
jgi:pyruvate dehydrogenase E1 component